MPPFNPPEPLIHAFVALTLAVVWLALLALGRAAPPARRERWLLAGALVSALWLGLHAGIARSGLLEVPTLPPRPLLYAATTLGVAVLLAFSPLGRRLFALPLALLVGFQAFRIPLEILLHALYDAGALPIQMTWSGQNLDILTGVSAAALGLALWRWALPAWVVWVWNALGAALLVNVVAIAVLSMPLPFRYFLNDPPVLLPFNAPWNWIVSVHVWVALVGHLLVFRALLARRARRLASPEEAG